MNPKYTQDDLNLFLLIAIIAGVVLLIMGLYVGYVLSAKDRKGIVRKFDEKRQIPKRK